MHFETNTLTVYTITLFFAIIFSSISFQTLHVHKKTKQKENQQEGLHFKFTSYQEDRRQKHSCIRMLSRESLFHTSCPSKGHKAAFRGSETV